MSDETERTLIRAVDMYYNRGMSQAEIGKRLEVSRSTVSRLLAKANEEGYVEIKLNYPPDSSINLERSLEEAYGLDEAVVAYPDASSALEVVPALAADYLIRALSDGMTVAMTRGFTMRSMVSAFERDVRLRFMSLTNMIAVPLMGASDLSQNTSHEDRLVFSNYLVDDFSRITGCISYALPAPHHVSSAAVARILAEEPPIAQVLELGRSASIAVFGIGGVSTDSSIVRASAALAEHYRLMRAQGAVGEVAGRIFNENGEQIGGSYNDELIGIDLPALKRIPKRVGIAWGEAKVDAIHAALAGGLVSVLITDKTTADLLLALVDQRKASNGE